MGGNLDKSEREISCRRFGREILFILSIEGKKQDKDCSNKRANTNPSRSLRIRLMPPLSHILAELALTFQANFTVSGFPSMAS
jgi:hypothetical protein